MSARSSARAHVRASSATATVPPTAGHQPSTQESSAGGFAAPSHLLNFDFTPPDPEPALRRRASGETIKDAIIRWLNEEL